jgi:hypothetical protein
MDPVEAVIARQRHDKHVSSATYTDETIEDSVFYVRPFLGNEAVNTFPQQRINTQ